jgi:hypothetical protein
MCAVLGTINVDEEGIIFSRNPVRKEADHVLRATGPEERGMT